MHPDSIGRTPPQNRAHCQNENCCEFIALLELRGLLRLYEACRFVSAQLALVILRFLLLGTRRRLLRGKHVPQGRFAGARDWFQLFVGAIRLLPTRYISAPLRILPYVLPL